MLKINQIVSHVNYEEEKINDILSDDHQKMIYQELEPLKLFIPCRTASKWTTGAGCWQVALLICFLESG